MKEEEEYVEIDQSLIAEEPKINVVVESLKNIVETEKIQSLVRNGNVVFLKIKELKSKNLNELKKAVDKLRKTCIAIDGDIVGIDEDYIVLCPKSARVFRGR